MFSILFNLRTDKIKSEVKNTLYCFISKYPYRKNLKNLQQSHKLKIPFANITCC